MHLLKFIYTHWMQLPLDVLIPQYKTGKKTAPGFLLFKTIKSKQKNENEKRAWLKIRKNQDSIDVSRIAFDLLRKKKIDSI